MTHLGQLCYNGRQAMREREYPPEWSASEPGRVGARQTDGGEHGS